MKPGSYSLTLHAVLDISQEISSADLKKSLRMEEGNGYAVCHPTDKRWHTGSLRILEVDGLPEDSPTSALETVLADLKKIVSCVESALREKS